jgi:hypothetical protein
MMQPEAPAIEVRSGFLGLFPNLQDQAHERKIRDFDYKRKESVYAAKSAMALEVGNVHTAREGMTLGKQLLDEADDEEIVIGPMMDLLSGMARRVVARSETHVTRYDGWAEQRTFGKE